jgi:stalled ribosome rescue protein Dom34
MHYTQISNEDSNLRTLWSLSLESLKMRERGCFHAAYTQAQENLRMICALWSHVRQDLFEVIHPAEKQFKLHKIALDEDFINICYITVKL